MLGDGLVPVLQFPACMGGLLVNCVLLARMVLTLSLSAWFTAAPPCMQVDGKVFQRCMYSMQGRKPSFPSTSLAAVREAKAGELALAGLLLRAVLPALLPPRLPLLGLSLANCQLQPAQLHGCSGLCAVTELVLSNCTGPAGRLNAALAALVQRTPRLERLTIEACLQPDDPFPTCLQTLSGPTYLSLKGNGLVDEDIPEARCWAGEGSGASSLSSALRCGALRCGAVRCVAVRCGAVQCWIMPAMHAAHSVLTWRTACQPGSALRFLLASTDPQSTGSCLPACCF